MKCLVFGFCFFEILFILEFKRFKYYLRKKELNYKINILVKEKRVWFGLEREGSFKFDRFCSIIILFII